MAKRKRNPRCVGGSWLFIVTRSIVAAHIYREDSTRVTVYHNLLGLSLSKCIRHGLIAKINGKRKLQTCDALGQILVDHSCRRCAPTPIASPHHAMPRHTPPGLARWASVLICFSLSPLLHTLASAQIATHHLSRLPSTSTSNVGLKSCHPPCMNGHLRFIRNYYHSFMGLAQ
jgi:hypothetical protein